MMSEACKTAVRYVFNRGTSWDPSDITTVMISGEGSQRTENIISAIHDLAERHQPETLVITVLSHIEEQPMDLVDLLRMCERIESSSFDHEMQSNLMLQLAGMWLEVNGDANFILHEDYGDTMAYGYWQQLGPYAQTLIRSQFGDNQPSWMHKNWATSL